MNGQQVQLIRRSTPRVLAMRASALFALAYAFAMRANAAAAGTLPWERPMTAIATSLTGPVAYAIGLIGIAIAGGAMLWGGELTDLDAGPA
jgi:type IV secretion system protein TrbC